MAFTVVQWRRNPPEICFIHNNLDFPLTIMEINKLQKLAVNYMILRKGILMGLFELQNCM